MAVFALMMVFSIGLAAMATQAGSGNGPGGGQGPEQDRNQAMARAEECGMFGSTSQSGGGFSGKYMQFKYANGTIEDYRVGDSQLRLFSSVGPEPFDFSGTGASGAVAYINGTAARFEAHNNPSSAMQFIKTGDAEVRLRFELAPGLGTQSVNGSQNIRITGSPEAVLVVENGNCTVNGSRIEVVFGAGDGSATVRAMTETQTESWLQLQDMVASGRLAGEIDIVAVNRSHTESSVGYNHSTSMTVKNVGAGKLTLAVQAEYSEGKFFRIGLDRDTAGTGSAKELQCRLDGEAMKRVSVQELERLQEQKSAHAAYCVEFGEKGCDVLAYVPHFSEHELTLEKATPAGTQTASGFEMALAVLVAGIVAIVLVVAVGRRA